jgi:hypothetical protein
MFHHAAIGRRLLIPSHAAVPLATRVSPGQSFDRALQVAGIDMRIALSGAQVLVTQELLYLAEICAGIKQFSREHVTQSVRCDSLGLVHARSGRVPTEGPSEYRPG